MQNVFVQTSRTNVFKGRKQFTWAVVQAFTLLAMACVILPSSDSLLSRQHISVIACTRSQHYTLGAQSNMWFRRVACSHGELNTWHYIQVHAAGYAS